MSSYTLAEFYQKQRLSHILKQYEENGSLKKFGSYLPNLRYKNGNIYYYSNNPIKFKSSKAKSGYFYQSEFKLKDLELFGRMNIYNNVYYVELLPKYLKNGLEICIKYSDQYDTLHPSEKPKIVRAIEYQILGINMFKDYYGSLRCSNDDPLDIDTILYDSTHYNDNEEVSNALYDSSDILPEDSTENELSLNIDFTKYNGNDKNDEYNDYDNAD